MIRDDEYTINELIEILREEQEALWRDFLNALYSAINGYWSIDAEGKLYRIWKIAQRVGFTEWEKIQLPLLTSGIYQQVLMEKGWPVPDMDLDKSEYLKQNPALWTYKEKWERTREEIATMNWEDE